MANKQVEMSLNYVVKITVDDDGYEIKNAKWCLVDPCNYQGRAALCTQQYFGYGESACIYETKNGKITCEKCREMIKKYKSIKL